MAKVNDGSPSQRQNTRQRDKRNTKKKKAASGRNVTTGTQHQKTQKHDETRDAPETVAEPLWQAILGFIRRHPYKTASLALVAVGTVAGIISARRTGEQTDMMRKQQEPVIGSQRMEGIGDPQNINSLVIIVVLHNSGGDCTSIQDGRDVAMRFVDKRTGESLVMPPPTRGDTMEGNTLPHLGDFKIGVGIHEVPGPWESKWLADAAYIEISGTINYVDTLGRRYDHRRYCARAELRIGQIIPSPCAEQERIDATPQLPIPTLAS